MFALTGDADGTQSGDDINIGVGELQECTITKSMDGVSHDVFDFTANETADTGTASVDTFSRTFTVTLSNPTSGDAFDFKAMEAGSTNGCTGDACNGGAAGILFGDGGDGAHFDGKLLTAHDLIREQASVFDAGFDLI
jgi:hypothetical protein